jgi:hypothetical protein
MRHYVALARGAAFALNLLTSPSFMASLEAAFVRLAHTVWFVTHYDFAFGSWLTVTSWFVLRPAFVRLETIRQPSFVTAFIFVWRHCVHSAK